MHEPLTLFCGAQAAPKEAVASLESLAAAGHAFSQYSLAKILADAAAADRAAAAANKHGDGGKPDLRAVRALELYSSAARKGVLPALTNVANLYASGHASADGATPDEPTARKWYEAAAEMGDPLAAYTLATWCTTGRGGPEVTVGGLVVARTRIARVKPTHWNTHGRR